MCILYVHAYVYPCVYTQIHLCVCVYLWVCVGVHMCACIVCMHVCACACIITCNLNFQPPSVMYSSYNPSYSVTGQCRTVGWLRLTPKAHLFLTPRVRGLLPVSCRCEVGIREHHHSACAHQPQEDQSTWTKVCPGEAQTISFRANSLWLCRFFYLNKNIPCIYLHLPLGTQGITCSGL